MYAAVEGIQVIGLVGHARAGKDTLAKSLCRMLPGAERFAFSDGIAAVARAQGRMQSRDPRVLQDVGWTARLTRTAVWIDVLYGAIVDRAPDLAVVTGVRFPDEAQLIRDMGGSLARVVRVEPTGAHYQATDRDPSHAVESHIDTLVCDLEIAIESGNLAQFDTSAAMIGDWLAAR